MASPSQPVSPGPILGADNSSGPHDVDVAGDRVRCDELALPNEDEDWIA